jgi:hypothetical protein
MLLMVVVSCLGIAAHWVHPNSTWGNCWSYAVPRWLKHGGYLSIRWSRSARLFGVPFIPHVIWVRELCEHSVVEQTVPDRTSKSWWREALLSFYFKFHVRNVERKSKWGDL